MLRDMLAFDNGGVLEVGIEQGGIQRHPGEEHGDGGEDIEAAPPNPGPRVAGLLSAYSALTNREVSQTSRNMVSAEDP